MGKKTKDANLISNVAWRFAEKWGCQAVNFIVTIIIARILDPSVYGVVAIVNAFIQIFTIFIDAGLGTSLIQKKDSDDLDFSTVFFANLILCITIYTIIFVSAPFVAKYYGIEDLKVLLRVSSISILIYSLKSIQEAYVSKRLIFKKFFFSSLAGTIGAGIVGILMALNGFGVWALVVSHLFDVVVDTLVMTFTIEWRPKLKFSFKRLKPLFNYSSKILLSGFINRFYNKMYHLIIGKVYTSSDLAYYDKGNAFTTKITENTDSVINSVLFPFMANKQDDKSQLKDIARKVLKINTYIMFPLLIGMFAITKQLVEVLLTSKWLSAVPYIQLFCLMNLFLPLQTININIIKAVGDSKLILKQESINKAIGIVILLITLKYGAIVIVFGKLLLNIVYFVVDAYPNRKILNYGVIKQLVDIVPNIFITLIMGVFVYLISKFNMNVYITLIIQIISGVFVYIILSIVTKNESFLYLLDMLKTKINKQKEENI